MWTTPVHGRPTFLGIGAHRAGTTWLHTQLMRHPDVWMPPVKEIHYFDRSRSYPSPNDLATTSPLLRILSRNPKDRLRTADGAKRVLMHFRNKEYRLMRWYFRWTFGYFNDRWYARLFDDAQQRECGEITPSYSMLNSSDVARLKGVNPDMKLIFLIRNPIERAWSMARFNIQGKRWRFDPDDVDAVITMLKSPGAVLRGDYERTLDTYLEHFSPSQLLVCFYDAIADDAQNLMQAIAGYLGVRPFDPGAIDSESRVNSSPEKPMPQGVREYLTDTYGGMIDRLAGRLGSYAAEWSRALHSERAKVPRTTNSSQGGGPFLPPAVSPDHRPAAAAA